MKTTKKNQLIIILLTFVIISIMLLFEFFVQSRNNHNRASQTSNVLLNQVENIIADNQNNENSMIEQLKEDYITRAKAVSYIIDNKPEAENDIAELLKIANLISVDEIHLIDATGTIYGGTTPQYYGLNFDSGEQISYFSPMLNDKNLSMCQDMTPNTAEGKPMMYATCWNDSGDRMIQIGIEPVHLVEELRSNQISEVVSSMPAYDGIQIIVADKNTYKIAGSTVSSFINKDLDSIGIFLKNHNTDTPYAFHAKVNGRLSYCLANLYDDYMIVIVQDKSVVNHNIKSTLVVTFIYLLIVSIIVSIIVNKMTANIIREQKNANTDPMTGFFNRRGYENEMSLYTDSQPEKNLVYVSIDLNGLKTINDSLGHEAGDEMIQGAAQCMKQCFGSYGNLFRMGGDEFAALIYADPIELNKIKQDFEEVLSDWSGKKVKELSVSCGYVMTSEYPDKTVNELASIADSRMYQEKENYYKNKGVNRQGQRVAFATICASYQKILNVNLTTDTYQTVQIDSSEKIQETNARNQISTWLYEFAASEHILKDNLKYYRKHTDLHFLRDYFKKGNKILRILYKKRIGDTDKQVLMEMIPSDDYRPDNQSLFLCVKEFD